MRYFTTLWISMVVQLTNQISINRALHLITSLSILYSSNYWIVRQITEQILKHYLPLCFLDLYRWTDQILRHGQVPFFQIRSPSPDFPISHQIPSSPCTIPDHQVISSDFLADTVLLLANAQCVCPPTWLYVGHIYKRCYNSIAYLVHAEPFRAGVKCLVLVSSWNGRCEPLNTHQATAITALYGKLVKEKTHNSALKLDLKRSPWFL